MRAVNPNAQPEVQRVLDYLEENRGNKLILGQHTQTMEQPELEHITPHNRETPGALRV